MSRAMLCVKEREGRCEDLAKRGEQHNNNSEAQDQEM